MESISEFLDHFKVVFTRPSFVYFERMVKGFLEVHQPKAVTELNQHKPAEEHFGSIYDFLKYYTWYSQDLANTLLEWIQKTLQPNSRVILAIDDTKNFKPHAKVIEGVCWHAEHHRVVQTKVKSKEGEELKAIGVVGQRAIVGWSLAYCIKLQRAIGVVFLCGQMCLYARSGVQTPFATNFKLQINS